MTHNELLALMRARSNKVILSNPRALMAFSGDEWLHIVNAALAAKQAECDALRAFAEDIINCGEDINYNDMQALASQHKLIRLAHQEGMYGLYIKTPLLTGEPQEE